MVERESMERGQPHTVLLVQSNQALRTASRELLEGFGHHILEAVDSREALEVASGHSGTIDLAVVEAFPRTGSGLDLTRTLRRDRPEVRVLLLSAFGEDPELRRAVETGEVVTLAMPFSTSGLRRAVATALGTPVPPVSVERTAPARPVRRRSLVPAWALAAAATLAGLALLAPLLDRSAPPPLSEASPAGTVRSATILPVEPRGELETAPRRLRWQPVPGASSYRVDVRGVDGRLLWSVTSDVAEVAVDPVAVAFAPAVRYSWRVEALDAGGRPLASSPRVWILVRPSSSAQSSHPQ